MGRSPALVLVTMFAAAGLAGCIEGFGKQLDDFDPLSAPRWEAGYWWSYQATTVMSSSYSFEGEAYDSGPKRSAEEVTVRVFNTTEPLGGEPVYYIRNDNPIDSPLLEASVQALTQDTLALAGLGGHDVHPEAPLSAHPMPAMTTSRDIGIAMPPPPKDACDGRTPIADVAPEERLEQFRFPLTRGERWSGLWSLGYGPAAIRYTASVDGIEAVDVPAGAIDAVRTTIDLVPSIPFADEDFFVDARIQVQNWYSPEVAYLVKSTTQTKVKGVGPDGAGFRYEYAATLELTDHKLVPGAAEPAPFVLVDDPDVEPVPMTVVSDTAFPVDLGAGPIQVRFGLVAGSDWSDPYMSGRTLRDSHTLPEAAPIDHTRYEVLWYMGGGQTTPVYHIGDTLEVNLSKAANYEVRAQVRPLECGYPELGGAYAWVPTSWTRTFHLDVPTATGDPIEAGPIPVSDVPTEALITWTFDPVAVVRVDDGEPGLIDPSGRPGEVSSIDEGAAVAFLYPAGGDWRLVWEPDGVPVGDDVALTLTMDFGARPYH